MTDAPQSIYVATDAGEPVAWLYEPVDWRREDPFAQTYRANMDPRHWKETPLLRISTEPFPEAVEYRKGEREAIVAWLRNGGWTDDCLEYDVSTELCAQILADALERGAHLPTSEGDE